MNISDIITLECVDLNYNGLGVCKVDRFPVFVEQMLIGEIAEVEITKLNQNYGVGELKKLIKSSKDRVIPICPIFDQCGGCDIMHLDYSKQLEFKLFSTNQTLKRLGNINYEITKIVGMDEPYYYRNKVQIPFQMKNTKVICGFYKKGTHEIVPFNDCFIQSKLATKIALFIRDYANKNQITAYDEKTRKGNLRHVLIRNTVNDDYMVVLITNEEKITKVDLLVKELVSKFPNIKTIIQNINNRSTNVVLGDKTKFLYGASTLVESICGLNFILSYKSFFQTNHIQTNKLYSKVLEYVSPTKDSVIVDGYCGVGTITIMLAQYAKYVYGIEIVEDAINDAIDNAKLNRVENIEFIIGKVEEEILKFSDLNINSIIVDPPRKGCDIKLLDVIMTKKIEKIVYVSCNEATLARDLKILEKEYDIKDITLYDMFPHSSNVESVVLLKRR